MQQGKNGSEQEGDFQDEACEQCIKKITQLGELIKIEERKLRKAMRHAAKLKEHS